MAPDPTAISQGDILQHAEWVRRLALALVRNPDDADELAQETWEAALSRPPRESGPLRPWLAGVARNLARMRARSSGRRTRREESAVGPEPAPSPEELVARVEMQQQVVRRVLDLDEPFRSTLLLRYCEGCSAAEIARRQEVPAGTVRWRLKRGLDDLRRQLDDSHQGDRKRWALLLAPMSGTAIGPHSPAPAPAGGSTLRGIIAMKTTYKIGLVVIVALLAVLGHQYVKRDKGESPAATGAAPAPAPNQPAAMPTPRVGAERVTREDDPTGALRLEGQVISSDESPVGGAIVAIDTNPPRIVTSEADGSFAFDHLIGRDYKLEARADDGYAGPVHLRLAEDTEPVILRVGPGASVTVEVRDADSGDPIAGAVVELRSTLSWTATTGDDGVARLKGVGGSGFDMSLKVAAPGYAPELRRVSPSPGDDRRELMTLHRGASVSGRAVSTDGVPIAGARVLAVSTSEPFPLAEPRRDGVITGKHGEWSVASVAPGSYRFVLAHPDYEPATTAIVVVDGATPRTGIEIRAAAGGEVRGTVTSASGVPVVAADVCVVASGSVEWRTARQAFTDADGNYVIHGLPRRRAQVVATHASGASDLVDVDLTDAARATANLTLSIDGSIDGTVVTGSGEPVPEAQVVAEPDWSGNAGERERWGVRGDQYRIADAGGRFHIGGLPAGSYRVRAARPGTSESMLWTQVGQVVPAGTTGLKLAVSSPGTVKGRVLHDDGNPPPAFTVAVGYGTPMPFATAGGHFSIDVPGGAFNLAISGPTFIRKLVAIDVEDGGSKDLGTVTVKRGRSISGRVLDASGVPVAAATVAAGLLLTGDGQKLYIDGESVGAQETRTDDQGHFLMSGFPPASITVTAGKDGVGRSQSLSIPSGASSAEVDLVLAATGSVSGTARLDGTPLAETIIIASPANGSSSNFFVTTGPDGSFALDTLTLGLYAITPIIGGGGDKHFRRVDIVAGQRAQVDIDITTGPGSVEITVKTDAGEPVLASQVAVLGMRVDAPNMAALRYGALLPSLPADGPPVPFYTRKTLGGPARVDHMKPGTYTVCAVPLPGDPRDPLVAQQLQQQVNSLPMKCTPVDIGGGEKELTITVPAAWTKPSG
ncbi:MAG TPA: sigma-70 family RNA polymerase sigma factor [Kofleriaceae bacterium]|nr:sigma-70 family RNA polymerase sigma factor [Kofleriaceae bacterium]